jgi:hypothetical protein
VDVHGGRGLQCKDMGPEVLSEHIACVLPADISFFAVSAAAWPQKTGRSTNS